MKLKALLKKNKYVFAAANALRKAPYPLMRATMRFCNAVFGVDQRKVVFASFNGRLYNENPRFVCEALRSLNPDAKLVFRLNRAGMKQEGIPDDIIKVAQPSLKALYHTATARVIVENTTLLPYMPKFKNQKYVQLWHGDRGMKKTLAYLSDDALIRHPDWKLIDLAVTGSEYGTTVNMRNAFGYKGEVMEVGYPRNDILLANPLEIQDKVRRALKLPENTRFILYAPTFRDLGGEMNANFSAAKLTEALEKSTGDKWLILNRGHILNSGVHADAGIDVSGYPEVNELLLLCDMMITDYSSIAGDYLLLDKPIILYHADVKQYAQQDRGLVFDPEESPYCIAYDMDELIALACHFPDPVQNCQQLRCFYGVNESGRSAMQTAERIDAYLKND